MMIPLLFWTHLLHKKYLLILIYNWIINVQVFQNFRRKFSPLVIQRDEHFNIVKRYFITDTIVFTTFILNILDNVLHTDIWGVC